MNTNKFINLKIERCGFTYTFDKTTTHSEFEAKMNDLGMNDWRVFGYLVYFYKRKNWGDEESDEESDEEEEE